MEAKEIKKNILKLRQLYNDLQNKYLNLENERDKAVSLLEEFTEADGNIELEKIYYKCIRFLKNNVRKQ